MSRDVEIGGIVNKDSTRAGFETNNLAATAREIEMWFFDDYVPTWVKAAVRKEGVSFICKHPMNTTGGGPWLGRYWGHGERTK